MTQKNFHVNMEGVKRNLDFPFRVDRIGRSSDNVPRKLLSATYPDALEICLRITSEFQTESPRHFINGVEYKGLTYPHVIVKPPKGKYTLINFGAREVFYMVYPARLLEAFEKTGLLEEPLCWNTRITRELELLLGLIRNYSDASLTPGNADRLDLLCFQLISELLLIKKSLCNPVDEEHELMLRIDSHLRLHAFEKIDFNSVARKFGLSRSSFFRYWKRYSNQSPAEYLLDIRLKEAAFRLKSTHDRVTNIAGALQLGESAHMGMLFKKHFGMTPLKYRQQYAAGTQRQLPAE